MASIETPGQAARQDAPRVILVGATQCGVAVTLRVVSNVEATVATSLQERSITALGSAAVVRWLAWYAPRILANGWQPYDQPHPAAYMPLGYEHLTRQELPDHGVLLRQPSPDLTRKLSIGSSAVLASCMEGEVPEKLGDVLRAAGIAAEHVEYSVRFLLGPDASSATNAA
jgi:hypothetical protein